MGDGFQVISEGAAMTLDFDSKRESETYVRFGNLSMNARKMLMRTFDVKGEREITKKVNLRNKYHNSYFGKVNFIINTGYSKLNKQWARITFPEMGSYQCDQIEVYSLSMKHVEQQLKELKRNSLTRVKESNNRIEGEVSLAEKGILVLCIPYSKGWSAMVDGVDEKLVKANIMYSAIELSEGEHHIVLTYRTPYLFEGFLLTIICLFAFIGISVIIRRKEDIRG